MEKVIVKILRTKKETQIYLFIKAGNLFITSDSRKVTEDNKKKNCNNIINSLLFYFHIAAGFIVWKKDCRNSPFCKRPFYRASFNLLFILQQRKRVKFQNKL